MLGLFQVGCTLGCLAAAAIATVFGNQQALFQDEQSLGMLAGDQKLWL